MPSFESTTEKPDKEKVTVRSIDAYATLWSQYISDATGSKLFYIFLAPFFFVQFILTLFTTKHLVLLVNPTLFPVQIPSTTENPPKNPIAYTTKNEYETRFDHLFTRPLRLFSLGRIAVAAYVRQKKIAYVVCDATSTIDAERYLVAEDEDSLRPFILFR